MRTRPPRCCGATSVFVLRMRGAVCARMDLTRSLYSGGDLEVGQTASERLHATLEEDIPSPTGGPSLRLPRDALAQGVGSLVSITYALWVSRYTRTDASSLDRAVLVAQSMVLSFGLVACGLTLDTEHACPCLFRQRTKRPNDHIDELGALALDVRWERVASLVDDAVL
ncbi:hypothetical protein BC628DRAFT_903269 [Trametes gibbosa]|nr:hypothetical protein BC628DRAFT_903269 [Trametes gibbosa]